MTKVKNQTKMKKLFLLVATALFTLGTIQTAVAQAKPEEIAKAKVAEMSTALDLTGDQQRALFRSFVMKEADYAKQINGKDLNNAEVANAKKAIDTRLDAEVKKVLTAEQYAQYKKMDE